MNGFAFSQCVKTFQRQYAENGNKGLFETTQLARLGRDKTFSCVFRSVGLSKDNQNASCNGAFGHHKTHNEIDNEHNENATLPKVALCVDVRIENGLDCRAEGVATNYEKLEKA